MKIEFLKKSEKKEILELLREQHGISKLNFLLIKSGKEKIRGFSGSLSKEEIHKINGLIRIEGIGLYLARIEEYGIRLSLDATHLLKNEIKKNIIELNDNESARWMRGENLEVDKNMKGFFVVKNGENFLGSGKANEFRLFNFIPKERRVK